MMVSRTSTFGTESGIHLANSRFLEGCATSSDHRLETVGLVFLALARRLEGMLAPDASACMTLYHCRGAKGQLEGESF
eukprot:2818042-Amphidinium_carterae.1